MDGWSAIRKLTYRPELEPDSFWIARDSGATIAAYHVSSSSGGARPDGRLRSAQRVVKFCCAGLLLPSLSVHAHHEEPQHHQSFHEEDGGQIVRGKIVSEPRWQKGQPTQTCDRWQRTQNSRQESRPEDEVANQDPIESVKCQADVHALRQKVKKLKGDCHEVEGRREQRESPVHRFKDVIEEQRYSDHARDLDNARCEVRCKTQPAVKEELGACCRQQEEQKKGTGNPGLETWRRFCNPFHYLSSAHIRSFP